MNNSPSLWPYLIPALFGLLPSLGVLWGTWLAARRQRQELPLLNLQASVTEATVEKTKAEAGKAEAERDSLAFHVVSGALADAERTITRLRQERDEALRHAGSAEVAKEKAEGQLKIYDEQIDKVKGVLAAHGLEYPS